MMNFRQTMGLWRSLLMYYGILGRQRRMRQFYGQFMQPGDICFDIGAHVGNRLLAWSRLDVQIVAVEPQPHLMSFLRRWYGRFPQITLIDHALAASPGTQTLHISNRHPTVTTMSDEWITAVQQDASFARVDWDTAVSVPVTTLDALIAEYGLPAFCKIDVEGYELEVLRGLSQPITAVSFEYIPAAIDIAIGCVAQLAQLGQYEFNWSIGESHRWQFKCWLSVEGITAVLRTLTPHDGSGDVYARLPPKPTALSE